jgi:hypothetical protein
MKIIMYSVGFLPEKQTEVDIRVEPQLCHI